MIGRRVRDVKGFEFSSAKATMFAPDFGVLTHRAVYIGKCFNQDLWPIWGTAFYIKHGEAALMADKTGLAYFILPFVK